MAVGDIRKYGNFGGHKNRYCICKRCGLRVTNQRHQQHLKEDHGMAHVTRQIMRDNFRAPFADELYLEVRT